MPTGAESCGTVVLVSQATNDDRLHIVSLIRLKHQALARRTTGSDACPASHQKPDAKRTPTHLPILLNRSTPSQPTLNGPISRPRPNSFAASDSPASSTARILERCTHCTCIYRHRTRPRHEEPSSAIACQSGAVMCVQAQLYTIALRQRGLRSRTRCNVVPSRKQGWKHMPAMCIRTLATVSLMCAVTLQCVTVKQSSDCLYTCSQDATHRFADLDARLRQGVPHL